MKHGPRLLPRPRLVLQMSIFGFLSILPQAAWADDEIFKSAVVTTTGGWTSNAFSQRGNVRGSPSVQVHVQPTISLVGEQNVFTLSGLLNYQHYFRGVPDSNDFGTNLTYAGTPSARLTTHAALAFDSSIIGAFDAIIPVANPTQPPPSPSTGPDLALVGSRARRNTLTFSGGLGYALSAYDSLSANVNYSRSSYGGSTVASNYDNYGGTLGYSRRLSEHLQLGAQGSASRYSYQGLLGHSQVYSLEATIADEFSDTWNMAGAVGVSLSRQSQGGSGTFLTGNLQLCRHSERASLCLTANDGVLPTGSIGTVNSKSVGASYSYKLTEHSDFSLSGQYSANGQPIGIRVPNRPNGTNSYVTLAGNYDRQLGRRISLIATTHFRRIMGNLGGSSSDFGGSVGVTVRIGDFR